MQSRQRLRGHLLDATALITETFLRGGTVLAAGNGGSAAQASHLAAELVGRFRLPNRPGLPVVALTTDSSILTAWANDVGWDDVFARGVEALGRRGDVLVGISTSGRSPNLVRAFEAARERGVRTLALLGRDGGDLLALADVALVVPSGDTQAIQDAHSTIVHVLCELVERRLNDAGAFERRSGRADARDGESTTGSRREPHSAIDGLAVTR